MNKKGIESELIPKIILAGVVLTLLLLMTYILLKGQFFKVDLGKIFGL